MKTVREGPLMARMVGLLLLLGTLALVARPALAAPDQPDIVAQIERLATHEEEATPSLGESIAEGIDANRALVSAALLPKLGDQKLTERQQAVYAWALGLAREEAAADALEALHRRSSSELVRANCLRALATIGGRRSGDYLLAALDSAGEEERFGILNLLGQMQHEAALPKACEILKADPREFYWQPILVFGKMGDKGIPSLLARIGSDDRNTRINAIGVLGQWLIPPEAAQPLLERFWKEPDAELRVLILSSLERTIPDFSRMQAVFEQVAAKEQDERVLKFARETLGSLEQMRADAAAFATKRQASAETFQREYEQLAKSAGRRGDYEALAVSSAAQDEPRLKALRERILQRDSDEAFDDYQRVNAILMRSRLAESLRGAGGTGKSEPADRR